MPNHTSTAYSPANPPTVVVIGAGIAGISAATTLCERGIRVVLLEARDRIGGRIHSIQLSQGPYIELGAQFLHGLKANPLFLTLGDYNINVAPVDRRLRAILDSNGYEITYAEVTAMIERDPDLIASISAYRYAQGDDIKLAQEYAAIFQKIHQNFDENDPNVAAILKKLAEENTIKQSMFDYKLAFGKKDSESNYVIVDGFSRLLTGMVEKAQKTGLLTVKLSEPVTQIDTSQQPFTVNTAAGQRYVADGIICTLPLGVLQQNAVMFTPTLPTIKQHAIDRLGCMYHDKIILEFDRCFWGDKLQYVLPFDDYANVWFDFLNLHRLNGGAKALLTCSLHSPFHDAYISDADKIAHVVAILKRLFKSDNATLQNTWVTHWETDPYTRGAYCYHPEGSSLEDNAEIAKPVGKMYFAGEHVSQDPSNVNGAYLSGKDAAEALCAIL